MTKKDFIDHGISKQAVAAVELIKELNGLDGDDALIHDTVEGETSLFDAVARALAEIDECEVTQLGCAEMVKKLSDRAGNAKRRADKLRGLIDQAFQMAEIKSHKFPTATISTKVVPRKLIVTDEASIPSQFFVPQPPALDRSALLAAVKDGPIAGAELSNGGTTIQIRRA